MPGGSYKTVPPPLDAHRGATEAVAYLSPRANAEGTATVGIVNDNVGIGLAIRYSTREFGRCLNWQHWGPGEYVTALEPVNGTVRGRAADRADGTLEQIKAGERKTYDYRIEVVTDQEGMNALRTLNRSKSSG
jgi:hypothetical protein